MATTGFPSPLHRDDGDGPAVVLLHGFPDTAATWDGIADHLVASGYRVVVPHLRGYHPDTIVEGRGYGARELAEDTLAVLDHAGLDQAVVVGHDWGAIHAYGAASLAPERVRGVVGVAIPHPRSFRPDLRTAWGARHFVTLKLPWAAAYWRARDLHRVDVLYRRWAPGWTGSARDACVARTKAAFSDPRVLGAALAYYRDLSPRPDRSVNQRLSMPALVVGGTRDIVPAEAFEESRSAFAGPVEVAVLEGAGHWPHREREEQFTERLLAWLDALPT